MIKTIEIRRKERWDFIDKLVKDFQGKNETSMLDVAGSLIKFFRTWRIPVLPEAERIVSEVQKFSRTSEETVVILAEVIKKLIKSAISPIYNHLVGQEIFESDLFASTSGKER